MKLRHLYEIILLLALILLQVLFLNRIHLFGYATPIIYSYFLLKVAMERSVYFVLISSFLTGLTIDAFLNTPGMNAAAITIVAAFQQNIRGLFFAKNDFYDEFVPSIHSTPKQFLRLTVFVVSLHIILLFMIEAFTVFNVVNTLLRIVSSALFSIIIIVAIDSLMYREKKISEQ